MATSLIPLSRAEKIKWLILAAILLCLFILPSNEIYTLKVKYFCMITFAGIYLMAVDIVPLFMASLLMPIGYWLFGVAGAGVAFGSFTGQVTWCVLGSLMMAQIMNKTGLGKRLAYKTLLLSKGQFYLVLVAFMVVGTITAIFVTTAVARIALFGSLLIGMCKAMDWKLDSKPAILLVMALSIGPGNMAANCWAAGSGMTVLMVGSMESIGYPVTWMEWAEYNAVPNILMMIAQLLVVMLVFKNAGGKKNVHYDSKATYAFIKEQYETLGKANVQEIKALIMFIATLILLLTSKYNGFNAGQIFMLIIFFAYIPGIRLLDNKDTAAINFPMVFMIAGCLAIGDVASSLEVGMTLTNKVIPYLPNSTIGICSIVFIICFLGNMMMTPMAMVGCLLEPLNIISHTLGVDPIGIFMIFINASAALLFPYETGSEMLLYSYGLVSMKNFIKGLAVRSAVLFVGMFVCYIPWFKIIGIL